MHRQHRDHKTCGESHGSLGGRTAKIHVSKAKKDLGIWGNAGGCGLKCAHDFLGRIGFVGHQEQAVSVCLFPSFLGKRG